MKKLGSLYFLILPFFLNAKTELNFLSSNNQPERKGVIRYLLDAFELYNPDIRVHLISYNENDPSSEILQSSENTPDLIMADSLLLYNLLKEREIDYELTESIIEEMDKDGFFKGTLQACALENCYAMIPYSAWIQDVWYRKDWFDQNGLAYPTDLEALLQAASFFNTPSEFRYGIILGKKKTVYTQQCFLHIAGAMGFPKLNNPDTDKIPGEILKIIPSGIPGFISDIP